MPGNKTTSSSTSTKSMPLVNDILPWAKGIVTHSGPGGAWTPNTTSMVTPFSKQTMSGLNGLQNTANNSTGAFNNNFARVNATLGDGGLNPLQKQQVDRYQGVANGNGLNSIQQSALNLWNPIAQGKEMNGNPWLDQTISRGSQDIIDANKLAASGMGRVGSTDQSQALNRNIGDFAGNLRFNDYNTQLGRRDAAIQNVAGIGGTAQAQRMGAIDNLTNLGTQQRQNVLNGTQQLSDAYAARKSPYQDLLGIGSAYEGKNSQLLQDQARIFDARKNAQTAPLDWIARLASQFQGGSSTTVNQQPNNPFGQGIGGFLGGYGLTGSPLGGLLGGLGGIFG